MVNTRKSWWLFRRFKFANWTILRYFYFPNFRWIRRNGFRYWSVLLFRLWKHSLYCFRFLWNRSFCWWNYVQLGTKRYSKYNPRMDCCILASSSIYKGFSRFWYWIWINRYAWKFPSYAWRKWSRLSPQWSLTFLWKVLFIKWTLWFFKYF